MSVPLIGRAIGGVFGCVLLREFLKLFVCYLQLNINVHLLQNKSLKMYLRSQMSPHVMCHSGSGSSCLALQ